MELLEVIPSIKSEKTLLKSNSSNGFGTTYLYNIDYLKREHFRRAMSAKKMYNKDYRLKSVKKKLFIVDEQFFFSQIKNKDVRNFYESVIKNACREKEPKTKHLKNIFRLKKSRNFLLKPNVKNEIESMINTPKSKKERKSRTSNNLPFIHLPKNINNIDLINNNVNVNNDIENNKKIYIHINNDSIKYKIPSIFLKKAKEKSKIKNESFKISLSPLGFSPKFEDKKNRTNLFKNQLLFSEDQA